MAKKKDIIKFDEVVIILQYKEKQTWRFASLNISEANKVEVEKLKDRLEACIPLLDGATEFPTRNGIWKKNLTNQKRKRNESLQREDRQVHL
jgi:hypothetical protein